MTELAITSGLSGLAEEEAIVYPAFEGAEEASGLPFELVPYMAKRGEATWYFGRQGERHYLVIGLGRREEVTPERVREAAGIAGRALRKPGFRTAAVSLAFGTSLALGEGEIVSAWTEGWLLGTYEFNKYRPGRPASPLKNLHFLTSEDYGGEIAQVRERVDSIELARDLVNEPGDRLNPDAFAERIVERFNGTTVRIKVYKGIELAERGMNGLLTVGRGSKHSPALVELVYDPVPGEAPIALVGKGVTFDMGGMNVKTGSDISDARMDMGGAAAVVGALDLLVRTKAKRNVVALIPIADNVPGPGAYLPSEIVVYPNGLTVQVKNTDAEGRLIMADAMLHAAKFGPAELIDVATLTGNVGQALGLGIAGMWGDAGMTARLHAAGEACGDRIWAMPVMDDYEEQLRSDYADLSNWAPTPYGGAILAALFLRRFSGGVPWVHIDMANTSQAKSERGYYPVGASGYGVRLLADYILGN